MLNYSKNLPERIEIGIFGLRLIYYIDQPILLMKILFRCVLITVLVCTAVSQSFSKQDSTININTIVESTQQLLENYPIEKVHLHFDKPYYAVGDTIWFKGYLNTNLFTYDPSKIIYVEVLNSKDSLIQTLKMPLVNNVGKGQLALQQEWFVQDNYRFRAYTKWMVNFDTDYFFNKVIPVGDVLNNRLHTIIDYQDQGNGRIRVNMQFMDRAGNLLGNSRVNWQAVSNFEELGKGRGDTDVMGKYAMEINAKDLDKLKKGTLHVSLLESRNSELLIGDFPLRAAAWDVDIQFFPEGGELIALVPKKVAFKVLASNGRGLKSKGELLDGNGTVIQQFEDIHAGMGYFTLNPEANQRYQARFTFENGQTRTVDLPEVQSEGIAVSVIGHTEDNLQMAIVANDAFLEKYKNRTFNVIAQSGGVLCYAAQAPLRDYSVLINLPKERLPTGIVQIMLFSQDGTPLSERLTFVETFETLDIAVNSDKSSYRPKEQVRLDLAVVNNDTTFAGNYSISVTDEQKVAISEDDEITILSNFLLTSDLKGYVEQPNYYFNTANENRHEALEALLMTQGYKRFQYTELIAGRYPDILFLPELGMEISGTLRLNNGRTVSNGGLLLSIPDRTFRTDTYTDENGRFRFTGLNFTDSSRVTINARGNENYRNMVIHVDPTSFPIITENKDWASGFLNIDEVMKPYLDNSRRVFRTDVLIDEVTITAQAPSRSHRDYPAIAGLSVPDHQVSGDRLSNCHNLLMCLQTALLGITYDPQNQLFYITRDYNAGGRIPVQFFINGMPVDVVALNGVMPSDVESIDIFMKDELGVVSRVHQNNGVVSIYTKSKQDLGERMSLSDIEKLFPKANIVDLNPLGYMKEYSFYVPKYTTPESQSVNDFRSTIYWNPTVVTDENGKASLEFYNADGRGTYRVVVEGFDASGNFGRAVYRYTVQ